jgi:hypothetical protein
METILVCLAVAVISGLLCFFVEKSEKINIHIDRHRDAILAALTGGTTGFFASLILLMIEKL